MLRARPLFGPPPRSPDAAPAVPVPGGVGVVLGFMGATTAALLAAALGAREAPPLGLAMITAAAAAAAAVSAATTLVAAIAVAVECWSLWDGFLVDRVCIDWAEQFHLVALGSPDSGVSEVLRIEHTAPAVAALITRLGRLEPDPAEVRVVLETSHGMLVEALVDAG